VTGETATVAASSVQPWVITSSGRFTEASGPAQLATEYARGLKREIRRQTLVAIRNSHAATGARLEAADRAPRARPPGEPVVDRLDFVDRHQRQISLEASCRSTTTFRSFNPRRHENSSLRRPARVSHQSFSGPTSGRPSVLHSVDAASVQRRRSGP